MPEKVNKKASIQLDELLAELPQLKLEKKQLSQRLQEIPLETKLLSLACISIAKETENLREILTETGKLKGLS